MADAPTTVAEPLPPFEAPLPQQEDLRGPAKDKKSNEENEEEGEAEAVDEGDLPAQLLPGPEALPAIDPQSNQLRLPPQEDAPPALPESLRQAALQLNMSSAVPTQAALPVGQLQVQQASWQQAATGLINPASAVMDAPEANSLQQAIYYEASDLSDSAPESPAE
jgi:hypothetical protein